MNSAIRKSLTSKMKKREGAIALLFIIGALEALVRLGILSSAIIAAPLDVIHALARLLADGGLGLAFIITFGQVAAAASAAFVCGLPLAYLLFVIPILGESYRSFLAALFAAPLVLLYPIFLVIVGRNYGTTIAIGYISGLIPVTLYAYDALRNVPRTLTKVGRSFHLTRPQTLRLIYIPAAVPNAFVGMRLGLIYCLVNIIGIEFLTDFGGMGRIVSEMFFRYDVGGMYASVIFIIVISVVLLAVLNKVERWLRPA